MSKAKLIGLILLVVVLGFGIYQSCCAVRPDEIGKPEVERLAEERFAEFLRTSGLPAAAFKREDIRFEDKVGVWHVVYRNIPGEKDRVISILVGKYGQVELHPPAP